MRQEFIDEVIIRAESLIGFMKTELASSEADAPPQTPTEGE